MFRKVVIGGRLLVPNPISLDVFEDRVYIADGSRMGITSASIYTSYTDNQLLEHDTTQGVDAVAMYHPLKQTSGIQLLTGVPVVQTSVVLVGSMVLTPVGSLALVSQWFKVSVKLLSIIWS